MATMTRRLQVLLDESRMQRLEQRAARSGTSVASLIRRAIDLAYPDVDAERRQAAGERLLSAAPMPVVDDWAEMKRLAREGLYDDSES